MPSDTNSQLALAAVVFSACAMLFSLLTAFPGLKDLLAAVRDGVLWLALFAVLGACGFVAYQRWGSALAASASGPASGASQLPPLDFPSPRASDIRPAGVSETTPTSYLAPIGVSPAQSAPAAPPATSAATAAGPRYPVGPAATRAEFEAAVFGMGPPQEAVLTTPASPAPVTRTGVTPVPFPDR